MRLAVVTRIPSPYQVELFDAIARGSGCELTVVYLHASDTDRSWSPRPLAHRAIFLDRDPAAARSAVEGSELAVFGLYRELSVRRLLWRRAASGDAWCFWGERPGARHRGFAGMAYRRLALWPLWRDRTVPIWGIGQWAIEGYRRELGMQRRCFDVPYGSSLARFLDIPRSSQNGARTILFSGSLIERKGILELVAAFRNLYRRRSAARLVVLGTGPLEARLRAQCANDDSVELLGFHDWDALPDAYARADILCAPSRYDGWGLVVPEAMAAGMPVVASDTVGSARELVDEGRTGWRVPPRDVPALERALENALDLPADKLGEMALACRERARAYDAGAVADRFMEAAAATLAGWERR
jgi:glycosyltransferase involved in cell wall biosynthesis